MALIYQSSIENSGDYNVEIAVWQYNNNRVLINVVAEYHHHLNNHTLNYAQFRGHVPRFYKIERCNTAKKGEISALEIEAVMSQV